MANHGMVCVGKSVDDALHSALVVEHNAQIMHGAEALGGVVPLPEKAVTDFTSIYDFVRNHMWAAEPERPSSTDRPSRLDHELTEPSVRHR